MKKKLAVSLILIGTAFWAAALLLIFRNHREAVSAGRASESVLPEIVNEIESKIENKASVQNNPGINGTETPASVNPTEIPHINRYDNQEIQASYEMTEKEIDGDKYIGYLSIPKLKLELPIMSDWSYSNLKKAPCRHFGSSKSNDLVIAGHRHSRHFGGLYRLRTGDEAVFVDMDGNISRYEVIDVEQIEATDVASMKTGGWDMTLYTCTYGGSARVAVRLKKIAD